MDTPKNLFTYELNAEQQELLINTLQVGNFRPRTTPYSLVSVDADHCVVTLYEKEKRSRRKLVIQGSGARDFVEFVLEPNVLLSAGIGYEKVLSPEMYAPHAGSDESGKGDYFGPLVVCAAYVDEQICDKAAELGVKDCKQMTDKAVLAAGSQLAELLDPSGYHIIKLNPPAYNRLYAKMRNINRMLAWAHGTAIEELLKKKPLCKRVVVDQFASTEAVIARALKELGRKAEVVQRHRAEDDPAVAAASVLARREFLLSMKDFPLGSSDPAVKKCAIEMVKENGPKWLMNNVKAHFTTTDKVLSECGFTREDLPEEGRVTSSSNFNIKTNKQG